MNADAKDILIGGLLPFLVAAVVFGLSLCRGASRRQALPGVGAALAVGLGFFTGYAALPWAVWTPEDSWHWLPYLVLSAMTLGMIFVGMPWPLRAVLALGMALTATYLLMPEFEELQPQRLTWQLTLCGSIFGLGLLADFAMSRRPDVRWGLCWFLTLMAVAVEMKLSYIGTFVQLALPLAAPMMVFALAERKRSWRGASWNVAPILAIAVPGLLWLGKFNSASEVPLSSYLWLLAAPIGFCLLQSLPEKLGRSRTILAYALLLAGLGWGLYEAARVSDFSPL
jgi:hypothetical protein